MTLDESVITIFTITTVLWVGGWVFRTLWAIGGRNELEQLADAQEKLEDVKRDLFD